MSELFLLDYGMVMDMQIEAANDHEQYDYLATQEDFDNAFK